MNMIQICFKCNNPYHEYSHPKSFGEYTSKTYQKYLCENCFDELITNAKGKKDFNYCRGIADEY